MYEIVESWADVSGYDFMVLLDDSRGDPRTMLGSWGRVWGPEDDLMVPMEEFVVPKGVFRT